jgi:hypothetical protein
MDMTKWQLFWRRVAAFPVLRNPMLSYGELVLRPVIIAERAAGSDLAHAAGHNKK